MNLIKHVIPVTYGRTRITIRHITDVHDGSPGFHGKLFEKFIRTQAADKNSYWILTGDMLDADRPSTKSRKAQMYADRKDAWTQEDKRNFTWIDKEIIPKYRRIKDRCLGILDGDHYILFSNGMTSGQYICRKLKLPYLGERMAFVGLVFKTKSIQEMRYVILARHGRGAGATSGADISALERQNSGFIADLYLGGHTHKENAHPRPMLYPNRNFDTIKQKIVWYVRGGSFLKGFIQGTQMYAEAFEYGPLCTGWAEIHLTLARNKSTNNMLHIAEISAELKVG